MNNGTTIRICEKRPRALPRHRIAAAGPVLRGVLPSLAASALAEVPAGAEGAPAVVAAHGLQRRAGHTHVVPSRGSDGTIVIYRRACIKNE